MGLTDYSKMEKEIRDAPQPYCIGKGKEINARITRVLTGTSDKNSARYIMPYFDVPAEPLAVELNDFFWDPLDYDKVDPGQLARNKARFSNFVEAFKVDLSKPIDMEAELPGKMGWIITGNIQEDTGYGEKSSISQYVTGPKAEGPGESAFGDGGGSTRDEDIPF